MDFTLTEDQTMMRDSAIRMVANDIDPVMKAHDSKAPLPKEAMLSIYASLANLGITAPRLPLEAGGGLKMLDYGLMFEQLPPVVAISLLAHECTIARIFAESTEEQRERILPDLISGKKICCTGTTEPTAGSDPRAVRTTVKADTDGWIINGSKMWITNATIGDTINVTCRDISDPKGPMRRVVAERSVSPFTSQNTESLGLQQGHLGELFFDNCKVPLDNALGESGDAARILTLTWNGNRPLVGLAAVHLAQKSLDAALEYAKNRKQFGKVIAGHQLIQANLADIEMYIVTARMTCYAALAAIDSGERANGLCALAKRYATTVCEKAVSLALHVHGAMGISEELGLERLFRDVRMLPIPDAANNILTLIQGRELTGISTFRDTHQETSR